MPKKAFLEITNVCNLSCAFCPGTERWPRYLSLKELDLLTDRLMGSYLYLYFHLMGEPLLHPELLPMIRMAKEKGFRPMITTNGTLLGKHSAALSESGVYKVSISLHSFAANDNKGNTFPNYISECIAFAKSAAQNGIIVALRLWNLHSGMTEEAQNLPVLQVLHNAFPAEWRKIRSGFRLCPCIFLEWGDRFDWPVLSKEKDEGASDCRRFCYGLRDQLGILCDGTVVPCCLDRNGDLALGNLLALPLHEILLSERAKKIYDGFTKGNAVEALCRRCGYANRFQRNTRGQS